MALYYRAFHADRTNATLESLSDAQFRVWTRFYSYASEQPTRGTVRGQSLIRLAAAVARGDQSLLAEALATFTGLGLITQTADDDLAPPTLSISGWDEAQADYPSETPAGWRERKRRQRARERSAAVPINRDTDNSHDPVTTIRDSHGNSHDSVTNIRDSHDDSHDSVTKDRDSHDYPADVTISRDTNGAAPRVWPNPGQSGTEPATPYITRAGDAGRRVRAEYTGHPLEDLDPENLAASESSPATESSGEENARAPLLPAGIRARADADVGAGLDAPARLIPVSAEGLAWWQDELEQIAAAEGVTIPAEWGTVAWLQRELLAMKDDYARQGSKPRDWGAARRKWLRDALRFGVRDLKAGAGGKAHRNGSAPAPGSLAPPPVLVVGPSDTERLAIGATILTEAVANMGARLRDGPGIPAAQAAVRTHLALYPNVHPLVLKQRLEALEKLAVARTLAELLSYARIAPAAPTPPQPDVAPAVAPLPELEEGEDDEPPNERIPAADHAAPAHP